MVLAPLRTHQPIATIRVANLPNTTSEADLRALFAQYATVRRVELFSAEPNGESRAFGYLDLSPGDAEDAVAALNGTMLSGSLIRVSRISGRLRAPQVAKGRLATVTASHDEEIPSALRRPRYEVASVEEVAAPDGGQGNDWYCYVLLSGRARITGFRRGTQEEVTAYAENSAEILNMRSATGKSTSALAHSRKK